MMEVSECPGATRLSLFLDGDVDEETIREISDHLEQCTSCADHLSQIDAESAARKSPVRVVAQSLKRVTRDRNHRDSLERVLQLKVLYQPEIPAAIGRYEVLEPIAQGAFGVVVEAYDPMLDTRVAIKLVHVKALQPAGDDLSDDDWLREVRSCARLRDIDGIVTIHDAGRISNHGYIVMDFIEGQRLKDIIASGRISEREALSMAVRLAESVQAAHELGIIHRDIKPSNIMLRDGRTQLVDFGLALRNSDAVNEAIAGTLPYMSPEQLFGEEGVDHRTDIWSLGVLLYEMLAGQRPYSGATTAEMRDAVYKTPPRSERISDSAYSICRRCLQRRKSMRYESADQLRRDLLQALASLEAAGETQLDQSVSPPGMRPFAEADSAAYLPLIPGPRDLRGIPLSINRWKQRIESKANAGEKRVFFLYGPSGAGKSSFVQAGLIPHLSDHIEPLFVRASPDNTHLDVLKLLNESFYCDATSLEELVVLLRKNPRKRFGKRVLIVVDQFEQWLSFNSLANSPLGAAIRHACCDISWLLVVRENDWMRVSQFAAELDSPLQQEVNCESIELLSHEDAVVALRQLAIWYGGLPNSLPYTTTQQMFLAHVVEGLTKNGTVNCARLALAAQILNAQGLWTIEALNAAGGFAQLELGFLDEMFLGEQAPSEYRLHLSLLQSVLRQLLPPVGESICRDVVVAAESDIASSTLRRALEILSQELGLITPAAREEGAGEHCYRISHEFLVPAISNWIARFEKSTSAGRAAIRLRERTSLWTIRKESRQLPNLLEWITLSLRTTSNRRTAEQNEMLRAASRKHCVRVVVATLTLVLLGLGVNHQWRSFSASSEVQRLSGMEFVEAIAEMNTDQTLANSYFVSAAEAEVQRNDDHRARLLFSLPLLPDRSASERVARLLVEADEPTAMATCQWLRAHQHAEAVRSGVAELTSNSNRSHAAALQLLLNDHLPLLELVGDDKQIAIRSQAIDAMARLDQGGLCLELLRNPRAIVRASALKILAEAQVRHPQFRLSDEQVDEVVGLLEFDPDAEVHSSASLLLNRIGRKRDREAVVARLAKAKQQPGQGWFVTDDDLTFVLVSGGKHTIGSPPEEFGREDDEVQHTVQIPHSFWVSTTPITCDQFDSLVGNRPVMGNSRSPQAPATFVDHQGAMRFCNALSKKHGFLPHEFCYEPDQQGALRPKPEWFSKSGFRLLSEAEWEVAARGGSQLAYSFANDARLLDRYGWRLRRYDAFPTVAGKLPNRLGIFDMQGCVAEWCQDAYSNYPLEYSGDRLPNGRVVFRGSTHTANSELSRCASRNAGLPTSSASFIGFRVCQSYKE